MVRNVSFKADDDFDDKLYSISKKRGITKSALIKEELKKVFGDYGVNSVEEKKIDDKAKINLNLNEGPIVENKNIDLFSKIRKEEKEEPKSLDISNSNMIKSIEIQKPSEIEQKLKKVVDIQKQEEVKHKHKFIIRTSDKLKKDDFRDRIKNIDVKKLQNIGDKIMGEEQSIDVDRIVHEKVDRILSEKEFNKNIKEMHEKISSIDSRICEDGKCTKVEFENIKRDIKKLAELDEIKKGVEDIKKGIKKVDICPECGEESVPYLSSYCSNCGTEIKLWKDDSGVPISGWKPYKNRK